MKSNLNSFSPSFVAGVLSLFTVFGLGLASGLPLGCASQSKVVEDPCLKRRGAIDIGSGSTKAFAAVVDVCSKPKRIVEKLFDEKVKISFGEALEQNTEGNIPPDVITDATAKIATLAESMNSLKLESIETVATAAIRKSKNRNEVASRISSAMNERLRGKTKLGNLQVRVLSQIEEAQVGARSALANLPSPAVTAETGQIVVWDIGGGSMQMTALDSNELFTSELASVTFKNQVIREIHRKDPSVLISPNPLKKNAKKATALARSHAEKNLGSFLKLHTSKPRWVGIGGVLALSVQKQVDREVQTPRPKTDLNVQSPNQIMQSDLSKTLDLRAARTDEEIDSEYRETEITNLALVLGYMQALKMEKIETVEASLVQGLLIQ